MILDQGWNMIDRNTPLKIESKKPWANVGELIRSFHTNSPEGSRVPSEGDFFLKLLSKHQIFNTEPNLYLTCY